MIDSSGKSTGQLKIDIIHYVNQAPGFKYCKALFMCFCKLLGQIEIWLKLSNKDFNLLKTQFIIIWLLLRLKHFENTRLSISEHETAIFKIILVQY